MTANATVSLTIRLKDAVTAPARGVKNAFKQIGDDFAKLRSGFDLAGKVSFAATAVNQLGAQARGALTSVLGPAMQFEEAIARAGALTKDITSNEMQDLNDAARKMGRETRYTGIEAAFGLGQLAIAGYDAKEQISALPAVLKLTQASGSEMGRTADILSDLVGAFNMKATDSADVAGMLAAVFSSSTTTLESLYETMKYTASTATQLKVPMRDVGILVGLLGNAGIKGSMAGTALNNSLLSIVDAAKKGKGALSSIGLSSQDLAKHLHEPIYIIQQIDAAFKKKKLTDPQRLKALYRIFGKRGVPALSVLLTELNKVGVEGGSAFEKLASAVGGGQTKLNQIAKVMDSTALAGVRKFQSAVESLKIDIATQLGPSLTPLIEQVTELVGQFAGWARKNPELVATVGKVLIGVAAFSAVFGPLLLGISSVISAVTLLRGSIMLLKAPFSLILGIVKETTAALGGKGLAGAAGAAGKAAKAAGAAGKAAKAAGAAGKAAAGATASGLGTVVTIAAIKVAAVGALAAAITHGVNVLIGKAIGSETGTGTGEAGLRGARSDTFNEFVRGIGTVTGIDAIKEIAEDNIQANKNLKEGMTTRVRKIGMVGGNYTMLGESNLAYDPTKDKGHLKIEIDDKRTRVREMKKDKGGFWDRFEWKIDAGANF